MMPETLPEGTTFDEFRRLLELERDKRDLTRALDQILREALADLRRQAKHARKRGARCPR
jgi:hypothetical protein